MKEEATSITKEQWVAISNPLLLWYLAQRKDRNMKTNIIRCLLALCLTMMISNLMVAQSTSNAASTSDSANVADQLKKLQDAMAQQQQQIALQQQELEKLRQQVANQQNATPQVVDASLHTSPVNANAIAASDMAYQGDTEKKESPLSVRIGGAEFTP